MASPIYDGYGSCPLTVERGKIVLAEFGYGGKLLPSFPGLADRRHEAIPAAWLLKEKMLPPIYWKAMLRGKEWMAKPEGLRLAEPLGPGLPAAPTRVLPAS
jgi:sulfide:quinone oxidoreductase